MENLSKLTGCLALFERMTLDKNDCRRSYAPLFYFTDDPAISIGDEQLVAEASIIADDQGRKWTVLFFENRKTKVKTAEIKRHPIPTQWQYLCEWQEAIDNLEVELCSLMGQTIKQAKQRS